MTTPLESFAREAWRASCAVNGRSAGRPVSLETAFACLKSFARPDCEFASLRQLAASSLNAAKSKNAFLFDAYSGIPCDV